MTIHRSGHKLLIILLFIFHILNFGMIYFFRERTTLVIIVLVITILIYLIVLLFFRNPKRKLILNEDYVYSPADGRIVAIEETTEEEYLNEKRIQVSIFMSMFDVHVNRYPVSGEIKYTKYHKGKYLVAWNPKSSSLNERHSVVMENKKFPGIMIRQIAGAVARRIVTSAKTETIVQQGDELGFIKFGSRVDLFLPLDLKINVRLNQQVYGNKTVIAEVKSK